MKKLLSIVIAVMLVIGCTAISTFNTFAADTASPDEAAETVVKSIKFTKLPDKLVYNDDDVNIDIGEPIDPEVLMDTYFSLNLDLTGAVIEAEYTDGTVENVDISKCTASLANPFKMGDIFEYVFNPPETEDMEKYIEWLEGLYNMIYHDYTVNVEYMGAQTSYTITFEASEPVDDPFEDESIYELVSLTQPDKLYYTKDDVLEDEYEGEESDYYLEIDPTGMEAVVKNKVTGELTTLTFDESDVEYYYLDDVNEKNQTLTIDVFRFVDEESDSFNDYVEFSFDVYYNFDSSTGNPNKDADNKSDSDSAATADTAVGSADNKAIDTGSPVSAGVYAVLILSGSAALFFIYRKKYLG